MGIAQVTEKTMSAFLRFALLASIAFAAAAPAADQITLNGAGVRKRVFFDVYAIGLYLPKKTSSAEEAISGAGPKRVEIRMLRDVSADQFSDALADGIRANHSEADAKALEPKVKQLSAIMSEVKEAKKGMDIALEWNGKATQVLIDGKATGAPIEGEDFYRALLRIWLGDKPVQEDLKKALLGSPS
jgi:hypothetical protein